MFKSISNFIKMCNLKKELNEEQTDDLYRFIRVCGFNVGFERFAWGHEIWKQEQERKKEAMAREYASGRFPKDAAEAKKLDPYYNPTFEEIRALGVWHTHIRDGVNITYYNPYKGWRFAILEVGDSKPIIVKSDSVWPRELTLSVWKKAKELAEKHGIIKEKKEVIEEPKKSRSTNRVKEDVNIDHVRKALGINENNKKDKEEDDDIDKYTKDLF